jgi:hypothetical protein
VELLNRPGRVYGYSGPLGGIDAFFYAGDTEGFNELLAQYARLKGTALTLLLHTGRENEDKWLESKKVRYDWKVHIVPRSRPVEQKKRQYTVRVEVRLGGQVELGKMKVPLNVQVKSGGDAGKSGEIAKFIAAHEAKRKEAEEADK